jgi:hypothetical protein
LTGSSFPSDDLCAFFRSFISFGRSAVWLAFAGSWAYFFYLGEYYTALTGKYSVLTSAWSLGVEEKVLSDLAAACGANWFVDN